VPAGGTHGILNRQESAQEVDVPATRAGLFATLSLSIGIVLVGATLAAAQQGFGQPPQDEMRRKGDAACKGDARGLCSHVFGKGDMAMLQCFQVRKRELSQSCRRFLTDIGQLY
jgi:hypothetical protein